MARIPYISPHGYHRLSIVRQWDSKLESNPEPSCYEAFLIYSYEVLVCNILFTVGWGIRSYPMFRRRMCPRDFLMSIAHENLPATGLSIVFHPSLMPDRSGWCDLIWFIMSSWPLSPVLALKEMGNQWIWGGWGGKLVVAVGNGEYEDEKAIFSCLDSLFFLNLPFIVTCPRLHFYLFPRPCCISHLYLWLYNNVNY